jgi:hypothetical protein
MIKRIIVTLFFAVFVGLLYKCAPSVAGVETTNGYTVTATSTTVEGTAPPWSQVFLFDTSYIPYIDSGVGIVTSTDMNGNYRIAARPGGYHVFVVAPDAGFAGISSETISSETTAAASTRSHTMERPGSITGSITEATGGPLLVYLAGMCHYELISTGRGFHFITVPPGDYLLRIARLSDEGRGAISVLHDRTINVKPGEAVQVGEINTP